MIPSLNILKTDLHGSVELHRFLNNIQACVGNHLNDMPVLTSPNGPSSPDTSCATQAGRFRGRRAG